MVLGGGEKTLWFWVVGKIIFCVHSQRGGLKGVYYYITIIMI